MTNRSASASPAKGQNFWQRSLDVLFWTPHALLHLGPIILVFLLVWCAASTGQVGDALGDRFSFRTALTALAIVLFWGVLTASTWVLVKVASGDYKKELEELKTVRLLVSGLFLIGVIFLSHYSKWWWVLGLILVVLAVLASLLWKKAQKAVEKAQKACP